MSRKLSRLAKAIALVTPLAVALPLSAAPVYGLSASCGGGASSDPSNCSGLNSEGHAAESLQYFNNGFTLTLSVNGTLWSSGGQGGAFAINAGVPVNVTIGGPSRNLVVLEDTNQAQTLTADAGTVGQISYGSNDHTVISNNLTSDAVSFDYPDNGSSGPQAWTSDSVDSHDFGTSMQLSSSITDGSLFGSMYLSETFRFYEADGVTPVNIDVAQTPEPASLSLLLAGIPACYFVARKRRLRQI